MSTVATGRTKRIRSNEDVEGLKGKHRTETLVNLAGKSINSVSCKQIADAVYFQIFII